MSHAARRLLAARLIARMAENYAENAQGLERREQDLKVDLRRKEYRRHRPPRSKRLSLEEKTAAVLRVRNGEPTAKVAHEIGRTPAVLTLWVGHYLTGAYAWRGTRPNTRRRRAR